MKSSRLRFYPKTRHFGFKRPVYFDPIQKDENENETEEKEEKKIIEPEPSSQKTMVLPKISFNISSDFLSVQNDEPTMPSFDWMETDIDKFENVLNNDSLLYDDSDIIENLNNIDVQFVDFVM